MREKVFTSVHFKNLDIFFNDSLGKLWKQSSLDQKFMLRLGAS